MTEGLQAHWTFDGQLRDQTGNGFDAAHGEGSSCEAAGVAGTACTLEPRGHMQVTASPLPFRTDTGYAASAFIKVDDLTRPKYVFNITVAESFAMKYMPPGGVMCIMKDSTQKQIIAMSSTAIREPNTWHHVACVYDRAADTFTPYVDGVASAAVTVGAFGALASPGTNGLAFGCPPEPIACTMTLPFTTITIDEVKLWSRSLSAAEVRAEADRY